MNWSHCSQIPISTCVLNDSEVLFADAGRSKNPYKRSAHGGVICAGESRGAESVVKSVRGEIARGTLVVSTSHFKTRLSCVFGVSSSLFSSGTAFIRHIPAL